MLPLLCGYKEFSRKDKKEFKFSFQHPVNNMRLREDRIFPEPVEWVPSSSMDPLTSDLFYQVILPSFMLHLVRLYVRKLAKIKEQKMFFDWYCGPELDNYQNCKFYVPETCSYRTSGSFDLFP